MELAQDRAQWYSGVEPQGYFTRVLVLANNEENAEWRVFVIHRF
jgi:hypothetical protein